MFCGMEVPGRCPQLCRSLAKWTLQTAKVPKAEVQLLCQKHSCQHEASKCVETCSDKYLGIARSTINELWCAFAKKQWNYASLWAAVTWLEPGRRECSVNGLDVARFTIVTDVSCNLLIVHCIYAPILLNVEAAAQHSFVNTSLFGQELSSSSA